MGSVKIEVDGISKFLKEIKELEHNVKQVEKKFLVRTAERIRGNTKKGTPRVKGILRNGWHLSYDFEKAEAIIFNNVKYVLAIEYGRMYTKNSVPNYFMVGKRMLGNALDKAEYMYRKDLNKIMEEIVNDYNR